MSNVIIYDTYNVNVTIENDDVVGVQVVEGFIHDVIAGTNISIDKSDPLNPVISSSGGGGVGDMVLASTQTNTGVKTFLDGTLVFRNVADTYNAVFSNTNTADRTYTFPDFSGGVLVSGATNTINSTVIDPSSSTETLSFGFFSPFSNANIGTHTGVSISTSYSGILSEVVTTRDYATLGFLKPASQGGHLDFGLSTIDGVSEGVMLYAYSGTSPTSADLKLKFTSTTTTLNLGSDATGDTYYRNSSGYFTRLAAGTNGHVLTLAGGIPSWAAPSAGALSALTAATGTNTINNAANAQEWQWNTLGAGTGLLLSSSSTAAASNTNTLFRVNQTGANATSTQTTYSGYFSNTKTGTSNTNVGLYATASGATAGNNYAIRTAGSVEITGSASQIPFYARANATANGVALASDGFTFNPIASLNTGLGSAALRWGNVYASRLFLGQSFPGSTETLYTLPNTSTGLTSEIIDNRLSSARSVSYTLNGTISRQAYTVIEAPTAIIGSTPTTTITNGYTLYVQDLPAAGANAAITNSWALGIAGNVKIDGTRVNIANLPTSAAGLATGDLWNNSGVINIA
jgi:hypothetical protein